MIKYDIIRMAREAKLPNPMVFYASIERFAALVAAVEREACAKVCEEHPEGLNMFGGHFVLCAQAIRARSQQ